MLSFRKRLALAHGIAIIVVLALAAAAAYWGLARAVHGQLDAALLALAETELGMLAQSAAAAPDAPIAVHELPPDASTPARPTPAFSFERLDRLVQIVARDGRPLARSANLGEAQLPVPQQLQQRLATGETVFDTLLGFGEEPTRMVSLPVPGSGRVLAIQVAGSLDDVNHVMQSAGVLFVVLGLALLMAVGAAGASLSGRVFGAIDDVVQQAHRIGDANLGQRLPHPGTRDEIGGLVDTLNDMLARLELSFDAQRRFTADASHELRSPMSRLRTELELALRRPREAADYVATLRSCLEEVERVTLLVEELLALARLDAGEARGPAETVRLDLLADEAVRRLEPMARERGVHLSLDAPAAVAAAVARGAANLVLANLLDNAIKFSPANGRVDLRCAIDGEHALLSVSDAGPGLRQDELPHLFERFFRGAAAQAAEVPGVGLGLALSQAIAVAHGGHITAANLAGGGACFTVRLPSARST